MLRDQIADSELDPVRQSSEHRDMHPRILEHREMKSHMITQSSLTDKAYIA